MMSNTAPLQRFLVWLRRHKEDSRSPSAGELDFEKNYRDSSLDTTSIDKHVRSHPLNTSLDRTVSISTRRSSKTSGSGWSTDRQSDDHAANPKRRTRTRRVSFFSSHNPDEESKTSSPTTSPATTRPPSYVPRHAASGHLRTTAQVSPFEKAINDREASQAY
ncbi:hypothetical protein KCU95_g2117, partial [Aureobasidium melanogenum]